jgi:hypothetical protein
MSGVARDPERVRFKVAGSFDHVVKTVFGGAESVSVQRLFGVAEKLIQIDLSSGTWK